MAILMIRHLNWRRLGSVIRRILGGRYRHCSAACGYSHSIILGCTKLYIWAQRLNQIADKHLREHSKTITKTYLTTNGFIVRAIFYFAIWNLLCFLLTKWSKENDSPTSPRQHHSLQAVAGPGLIL